MNSTEIPVVVLTRNSGRYISDWIENVSRLSVPIGHSIRPVVIDNASTDSTVDHLSKALLYGTISETSSILLPDNYGFCKAHNVLLRRLIVSTSCRYVAFLNHDATADSNWLNELIVSASKSPANEKVGMWGGPIFCPDSARKSISSAGHFIRESDAACLDVDFRKELTSNKLLSSSENFEAFCPCFAASLWSLDMIREIGLMDGDQFMYYDDIELGYRARMAGWKAKYVPSAHAYHPLPKPKPAMSSMWRHQQKGRLAIVHRYLPDDERTRILANMPPAIRAINDELLSEREGLTPIGTNEARCAMWRLARAQTM